MKKGLCTFLNLALMMLVVSGALWIILSGKRGSGVTLPYIERHPDSEDFSFIVGKVSKLPEFDKEFNEIDIRSADLSEADLSKELDKLLLTTYDSKTVWPKQLPKGFESEAILNLCKDPGLGVRKLHEKGITGKNIGIAIIDQVLLTNHEDYKNQLRYYSESKNIDMKVIPGFKSASMHGPAVASIAVGKSCGVAPEADLYYIAENFVDEKNINSNVAKDINKLLDLNKTLKESKKIRVISISWEDKVKDADYKNLKSAYQRAAKEGVLIITALQSTAVTDDLRKANTSEIHFIGLGRFALSDPNDYSVYTKVLRYENEYYSKDAIGIPMDNRGVASPTGEHDYVKFQGGGSSWCVPYIAGVYALACQVEPNVDGKEFWKIAMESAVSNKELDAIINPQGIIDKLMANK